MTSGEGPKPVRENQRPGATSATRLHFALAWTPSEIVAAVAAARFARTRRDGGDARPVVFAILGPVAVPLALER